MQKISSREYERARRAANKNVCVCYIQNDISKRHSHMRAIMEVNIPERNQVDVSIQGEVNVGDYYDYYSKLSSIFRKNKVRKVYFENIGIGNEGFLLSATRNLLMSYRGITIYLRFVPSFTSKYGCSRLYAYNLFNNEYIHIDVTAVARSSPDIINLSKFLDRSRYLNYFSGIKGSDFYISNWQIFKIGFIRNRRLLDQLEKLSKLIEICLDTLSMHEIRPIAYRNLDFHGKRFKVTFDVAFKMNNPDANFVKKKLFSIHYKKLKLHIRTFAQERNNHTETHFFSELCYCLLRHNPKALILSWQFNKAHREFITPLVSSKWYLNHLYKQVYVRKGNMFTNALFIQQTEDLLKRRS